MKHLFITEKPSVAMQVAAALGIRGTKHNGYIESDNAVITWCVGHLVCMSYPEKYNEKYKEWNLETLPFLPGYGSYKYEAISKTKEQFDIVSKLYHRNDIDVLYIFPDDGQEGFYLQMLVLEHAKINPSIQIMCCLTSSQTEEEITRAYNEAIPWSSDRPRLLSKAGRQRAIEDYLVGINYSRGLTVKYESLLKEYIGQAKGTIAVGRVMCCVLGMIVKREREIASFVSTDYFKPYVNFSTVDAEWVHTDASSVNPALLFENKGFIEKEEASRFVAALPSEITVEKKEEKIEKKSAPLLYSLTELQADASRKYKYSPAQTLESAQNLYEKKLTTYPRTDSRYLTESVAKEAGTYLTGIKDSMDRYENVISTILSAGKHTSLIKSRYVNDEKVSDHFAIIPTGKGFENYDSLTEKDKNIFKLIVERFLSIFLPNAEYSKIEVQVKAGNELFTISKRLLSSPGYLELIGTKDNTDEQKNIYAELSSLLQGKSYPAIYRIIESQTTPPKRYSSDSLILAMNNAGNYIENEELREVLQENKGIGTTATRVAIIDKLVKKNAYIALNEKTQIYTPTYKGELIYDVLNRTVPTILNPVFSASWTQGLKQIESGKITDQDFFEKLEKEIRSSCNIICNKDVSSILNSDFASVKERYKKEAARAEEKYTCPVCGKAILARPKCYICENYGKEEDKCHFFLNKEISGKKLSDEQCRKLLKEKQLGIIEGFKKKDGSTFSAPLYINPEGRIVFDNGTTQMDDCKCPICMMPIESSAYAWDCKNCGIHVPKKIGGKLLSDTHIKKIMSGEGTDFLTFKKKDGSGTYTAKIILNTTEKKIEMKLRSGEVPKVSCPVCGGTLSYTPFGLKCNFCDYVLFSSLMGRKFTDAQMIKLLTEKELPKLKYKGKDGKEFETAISMDEDGKIVLGAKPKVSTIKCPNCQENMIIKGKIIKCDKCSVKVPYIFSGRTLSQDNITNLIKYGRSGTISGFKSKNNKKFSANIVRKLDGSYGFDFPGG